MNNTENEKGKNQLVYGFLCEQTNVFYAFETFQEYQEFLSLLPQTVIFVGKTPELNILLGKG